MGFFDTLKGLFTLDSFYEEQSSMPKSEVVAVDANGGANQAVAVEPAAPQSSMSGDPVRPAVQDLNIMPTQRPEITNGSGFNREHTKNVARWFVNGLGNRNRQGITQK